MDGDCFDIFSVNNSNFLTYCNESTELSLYIYNDQFENIFFNIKELRHLQHLTLIGLSNHSKIQIFQDAAYQVKLDFVSNNISINFISSYSFDFTFSSIATYNTIFQTYSKKISSELIKTDVFSLPSYPPTILCSNFEIEFSSPLNKEYSLSFQSDNKPTNIILTSSNEPFLVKTSNSITTIESTKSSGILLFFFNFTYDQLNLQFNDKSESNNITIISTSLTSQIDPWSCGYFTFSFINSGNLTVNFDGLIYHITSLHINKLILNCLNEQSTVIKLHEYTSFDPNNYPCTIHSADKIIIDVFTDSQSMSKFTGNGQINFLSDFHVDNFNQMALNTLSFKRNNPYIYVDITRNKFDSSVVTNSLSMNGTINIVPYYYPSKFSIPEDVSSLLNKKIFSICAHDININNFTIACPDENENPPGFTNNDLSFSLKQVQNCVSLFFEKDPEIFTTTSCIYTTNSSLCEQITDNAYNAAQNESPFSNDIKSDYINVIIVESLPDDYILNIDKLTGYHHVNFTYQGELDQSIPLHFVDSRLDSTGTSLLFNQFDINFETKSGNYDKVSLLNGAKITNYVNLEKTMILEVYFSEIIGHRPFYSCKNVVALNCDIVSVIYTEDHWTFQTCDQRSITISNSISLTLSLDQDLIRANFSSSNIKPLTYRVNTKDLFSIDIEGFPSDTLSTSAILIDFTSQTQIVKILLPNDKFFNFPVSFSSLNGASTFEDMKRIFILSNTQTSILYLNALVINETSDESFIAFSKLSDSQQIFSSFPGIEINSNAFIISETFDKVDQFKTVMYSTSNLVINNGATATLIYPDLKGSIVINDKSHLVLFHPIFADMVEINYNVDFINVFHHETPDIKLLEKQGQLEMTSRTPFYIPNDNNDKPFKPKSITVQHKLSTYFYSKMMFMDSNNTIEYPILYLKSTDKCDDIITALEFDPPQLITNDGVINFDKKCKNNNLIVICTYQEVIHTTPPKGSNNVNIIIISTLSSVLLIAIIIIVVLVIKKRKKQTPEILMKSMLLSTPKDI